MKFENKMKPKREIVAVDSSDDADVQGTLTFKQSLTESKLSRSSKQIDSVNSALNVFNGYRLVRIDDLWYIQKRISSTVYVIESDGAVFQTFVHKNGSWTSYEWIQEMGTFHECSYSTKEDAIKDMKRLVFDGIDSFRFDEVIEF